MKFFHARDYFPLLHRSAPNHKFINKNHYLPAWRDFKINFSRPLFTIIFRPKMLFFVTYSILNGQTKVEFVIYWVLNILELFSKTCLYRMCGSYNIFKKVLIFFAYENMKKPPSKVAHNQPKKKFQYCQPAQNQPKSQFLYHKNSLVMTLIWIFWTFIYWV